MLKRSFAEFHAQRAAPEALEALQQGQRRLAQLRAQPWPGSPLGTGRQEVEEYHRLNMRIEELSCELQVRPWSLSSLPFFTHSLYRAWHCPMYCCAWYLRL